MADAAYLIAKLNDAQVTVTATESGGLLLEPQNRVSDELKELVRRYKPEIIAELRDRWPGAKAPGRDYALFPPRRDEYPLRAPRFPQSYIRRRRR